MFVGIGENLFSLKVRKVRIECKIIMESNSHICPSQYDHYKWMITIAKFKRIKRVSIGMILILFYIIISMNMMACCFN